jgi:hypothetical protein
MLNGRVGEVLDRDYSSRSGSDRVAVRVDGEGFSCSKTLLKLEKLLILNDSDADNGVKHYTLCYTLNQLEPNTFKFALYGGEDLIVAGSGNTANDEYATSLNTIVLALKMLLSGFHFNTPTRP